MRTIIVKTSFQGKHYWREAPEDVSFLAIPHDHEFNVEVEMEVTKDDREVEFYHLKRVIDQITDTLFANKTTSLSCEKMAEHIVTSLDVVYPKRLTKVIVYEDNRYGGSFCNDN